MQLLPTLAAKIPARRRYCTATWATFGQDQIERRPQKFKAVDHNAIVEQKLHRHKNGNDNANAPANASRNF